MMSNMYLKYLKSVLRHKWFVFLEACKLGIPWRGLLHDMSKFRHDEFIPYARHFFGDYPLKIQVLAENWPYNGPFKEEIKAEFDLAWIKHQRRNKHHWQWWVLLNDDDDNRALPMPDVYRREMLADWRGAGRTYGDTDTAKWYQKTCVGRMLHPDTQAWVEEQLGLGGDTQRKGSL